MGKKGLWANMHAKRKRGESPAKPGDKDYPTDKALKDSAAKMVSPFKMGPIVAAVASKVAGKVVDKAIDKSPFKMKPSPSALKCWKGYERVPGTKEFSDGSCEKK